MEPNELETIPENPASPADEPEEAMEEETSDYLHIEWAGYI
ncbi:hypothetical protein [Cohnella caldifontis]|nr:hypothetical protein [Cohnella sp. YIM B05605]